MISLLCGRIELKTARFIILDLKGIGYRVFCPFSTLKKLKPKEQVKLFTHQHLRQDTSELYGFLSFEALEFFETLISVSGIGPKAGLSVMSLASVNDLKQAIASGQRNLLTKVSGIGSKTAERIILELKDKVFAKVEDIKELSLETEALEALISLGYSATQARDALRQVSAKVKGVENRVKEALKILGR